MIVLLAGGTGGAKLARGMLDVVEPERLTVVVNTADDVEVYGVQVSPDPDLVTYWLADAIDEGRGYGLRGDSTRTMEALRAAGREPWFGLGDRDLATCLIRTELIRGGRRPTEAAERIAHGLGLRTRVLPMTDDPVHTHVRSAGRWIPFQEFMVVERAAAPIDGVELRGASDARATREVLEAIAAAEVIVIGPSNPVISIGPILAVPGVREALAEVRAPVVAVSPFVDGQVVKGPTAAFCEHAGLPLRAEALVEAYGDFLTGVVADEPLERPGLATLEIGTHMDTPERRRRVAAATLEFAGTLRRA